MTILEQILLFVSQFSPKMLKKYCICVFRAFFFTYKLYIMSYFWQFQPNFCCNLSFLKQKPFNLGLFFYRKWYILLHFRLFKLNIWVQITILKKKNVGFKSFLPQMLRKYYIFGFFNLNIWYDLSKCILFNGF